MPSPFTQTAAPQSAAKSHFSIARPEVSPLTAGVMVTVFILAFDNDTFWARGLDIFDGNMRQLAVFGLAIWSLTFLTLMFFGFRWLFKPMAIFLLILSAVTSYYMDTLGIVIDREMIQNAMLTTVTESKHLITFNFISHVLIWGVLPSVAVLWLRLRPSRFATNLWRWALTVVVTLALFFGALFSDFKAYSAVLREHKELVASYQPGAAIGGAARYAKMMLKARDVVVEPLGRDATKGALITAATKPVLTVVFVGETARAQNFSLNGYPRPTNPELAKRPITNFTDVSSCGTSTAVSVPCMMSNLTRDGYSYDRGIRAENVMDVLTHAGVDVIWWDNNTGDQGTAAHIKTVRRMTAADSTQACANGECTDAVFFEPLKQVLPDIKQDTVLFIHMIGSHGPSYYLRYPSEFSVFEPACKTAEFAKCTTEEIVNAYDNTILFSDHVIATTIDMLAAQDSVIPAVYFVSDHGESLGEDGLYLHAAPYFMAPETQTTVPMVMWLSQPYQQALGVTQDCLNRLAAQPISHDNVFHTLLGLMDIQTEARQPDLDLTATCRSAAIN